MKIGYVGLDNSHCMGLIPMVNVDRPDGLPDGRFTHIWGRDPDRAREVQEKGRVETIVEAPEAMIGQVDAVVVGSRAGDRHLAEARPFVEAGMPVYVDKPFTNSLADAEALVELAAKHGARLTSFSGLRVVPEVTEFKAAYRGAEYDRYGGAINGHGDDTNPYGGWYFYAVHAIELLLEVWAPERGELLAAKIGDQLHVRVAADGGEIVTIQLSPKFPPFSLVGFVDHATTASIVPLGGMQQGVTERIMAFYHGADDLSPRELLAPLKVMEAIRKSLAGGEVVAFED